MAFRLCLTWRFQIHRALGGGFHHDLFHVAVRRVQQSATLRCCQHGDRARAAGGAQVGPFQRIYRNVHGKRAWLIFGRAHLLADEQHRRCVALALADHDGAVDRNRIEAAAHRLDGGVVRDLGVSHAHGAG